MLRGIAIAPPGIILLGALAAMRLVGLLIEEWQSLGMAHRRTAHMEPV